MLETLYVVRHGETEWNTQQRMQGRLDSALTARGRTQALANGELIQALGGVDGLWVSPAGRTRETASLINGHTRALVSYHDELQERDCGQWSGMTVAEIAAAHAEAWDARRDDPYHHRPPQGENLADMSARVSELVVSLLNSSTSRVAIVTHGVMSKVILQRILNLDSAATSAIRHPNELVYRLTFEGDRVETEHFLDAEGPHEGLFYK